VVVNVLKMAMVGPTISTAMARVAASIRLPVDRHLIPRPTPLTAETKNKRVVIMMMPAWENVLIGRSLLIWVAPMPSEVATPNAAAMMASTLKTGDRRCTNF
jgi:hypothetical protein